MQQDLIFKQQEFVESNQLGSLADDYAINIKKMLANFGFFLVFALIAPPIVFGIFHTTTSFTNFMLPSFLFFTVVGGAATLGFYFSYRELHIYLYTYGLVYSNRNRSRVVHWQQMQRAYTSRGYLNISVKNETGISIPTYVSRFRELRDRVQQAIANASNAG